MYLSNHFSKKKCFFYIPLEKKDYLLYIMGLEEE